MHTPGPWSLGLDPTVIDGADGKPVAEIFQFADCAESDANAALILAAPELLEACRKYHAAMDTLFAMLTARDPTFFPTRSGEPWAAIEYGHALIRRLTP